MKPYKTKSGATQYKPSLRAIELSVNKQENRGWCLACGSGQRGIEPDAIKLLCDCCGAEKVYGAEELVLMGLYY